MTPKCPCCGHGAPTWRVWFDHRENRASVKRIPAPREVALTDALCATCAEMARVPATHEYRRVLQARATRHAIDYVNIFHGGDK